MIIITTAVTQGVPIVTRNVTHFRRVPDLGLVGYGG
ncbi:MAG: type II toxin-antitoxin system VapC family toxin [Acidobacteriota bacterium]